MKNKWATPAVIGFIFVLLVGTVLIVHSQKQNNQNNSQDEGNIPIADYNAPLPSDSSERAKREKKNKNHNLRSTKKIDSKRFMITEERNSSYGGFDSDTPAEPAIPAARSNVVVIGDVTDSKAYLSEDKTSIYSEFTVNIDEVLKNNSSESIGMKSSIISSRSGGAVRFLSGKVIKRLFDGKPMPRNKSKYLLFLKYDSEEMNYHIITAYELRKGEVIPLDGLLRNGRIAEQLAAHQSYRGISETAFLNLVREAIIKSTDVFERKVQ